MWPTLSMPTRRGRECERDERAECRDRSRSRECEPRSRRTLSPDKYSSSRGNKGGLRRGREPRAREEDVLLPVSVDLQQVARESDRPELAQHVFGAAAHNMELCEELMREETDVRKLEQRQKQIDFGKNTLGYSRYVRVVPRHARRPNGPMPHPATPNIKEKQSKRRFDGRVRDWRRALHSWDVAEGEGAAEGEGEGEGEGMGAGRAAGRAAGREDGRVLADLESSQVFFSPTHPFLPYVAPHFSHISPFNLFF